MRMRDIQDTCAQRGRGHGAHGAPADRRHSGVTHTRRCAGGLPGALERKRRASRASLAGARVHGITTRAAPPPGAAGRLKLGAFGPESAHWQPCPTGRVRTGPLARQGRLAAPAAPAYFPFGPLPCFFSSFSISAIICSSPAWPPRCWSICGFILCIICATVAASMLCKSCPALPIFLFFLMVFCIVVAISLNWSSSSTTSSGWCPDPRAMRSTRDWVRPFVSSSSASVIESIMVSHFLIRAPDSWKSSPPIPGN
mmetsp:Transcript_34132/g.108988  ORF Transcript_34132/g.108988 Transcript_34132/m.108988 type:complete len:255 (+) Transcript_34132:109-873(+)